MKLNRPIVFFDLETTGTKIVTDRIVQIATIKINVDGSKEEKKYLVNPEMAIPAEATAVHGITDEMVKDAPTFKRLAKALLAYLDGCDLGGFNSDNFDIPLLTEEFLRCDIVFGAWNPFFLDVLKNERRLLPHKLADVFFRRTGVKLEDAHDALVDVRATVEVFEHQLMGEELAPEEVIALCEDPDKKRFDIAGKLYEREGVIYWNFGKHKDKPYNTDLKYLEWVLNAEPQYDIPQDTKNRLKELVKK